MNVPADLLYSTDHEWVRDRGDGRIRIGITDYAQDALGDVVFVEVPVVGFSIAAGSVFGEVESTKSVTELFTPVEGEVVEVNDALELSPGRINEDPYGDGWICVLALAHPGSLALLMGAETYRALIDA